VNRETRTRFEKLLHLTGAASEPVLKKCRETQQEDIPSMLVTNGWADRQTVLDILGEVYRIPAANLASEKVDPQARASVSDELCRRTRALPLRVENGHMLVAFADPEDLGRVDMIQAAVGRPLESRVTLGCDILAYLQADAMGESVDELLEEIAASGESTPAPSAGARTKKAAKTRRKPQAERLVDDLLQAAARHHAMDVCLIPYPHGETEVRMRVTRKLVELHTVAGNLHGQVVDRLRCLAKLAPEEESVPQNGSFPFCVRGHAYRMQMTFIPSTYGEAVVAFVDAEEDNPSGSQANAGKKTFCSHCEAPIKTSWAYCSACGHKAGK
jgi:type II secretory ATPase GspE/PulE/Tfp pilus assembly ATPase PilB-like protein